MISIWKIKCTPFHDMTSDKHNSLCSNVTNVLKMINGRQMRPLNTLYFEIKFDLVRLKKFPNVYVAEF